METWTDRLGHSGLRSFTDAELAITGMGSDIARDSCWALPANVRDNLTLEEKAARGCNCMGISALRHRSGARHRHVLRGSVRMKRLEYGERVMLLDSQGKSDSVLFFAPMAIESYRMLSPLNIDQRYDLGRIAEVSGALPLAKAQADTILLQNPTHLLGLVLATRVAIQDKRASDAAAYSSKLHAVYSSESAKKLPEYDRHKDDIQNVLAMKDGSTKK